MKKSIKLFVVLAIAALTLHPSAHAGSHTWSGANSVYFNNASNWSFGGAPTNGEQNVYLYFPAGVVRYNPSNNIAGLTVTGIGFTGDNYTLYGNNLTLVAGTNVVASGNNNALYAPLTLLGANTAFSVAGGKYFYVPTQISGVGHLTKIGLGTMRLNGASANTYTGTTYMNEGVLQLGGTASDGMIPGALVVGTAAGSAGTVTAQLLSGNQIPNPNSVTVNNTGVLDLNNNADWINALNLGGSAKVKTGTGHLVLNGDLTVQSGASSMDGEIWLMNGTRTMDTAAGGALTINAVIKNYDSAVNLIKTGSGSVTLKGINSLSTPVIVKQGYLNLSHNSCLNGSPGLTVTNAGVVQLSGVNMNRELTLGGNGLGYGALRSSGTNTWSGGIKLAVNSSVECFAATDLLTIDGIIHGTGALTKLGAGKVIMTGANANTYTGATTVKAGTLELNKTNAVAIPGNLIVGDATNAVGSHVVLVDRSHQIGNLADVTLNASGSLNFTSTAKDETIGSLAGAGTVSLTFCQLHVGTNNNTTTFSGQITGINNGCSLTKEGTGTFFLNGISWSFSGTTHINDGVLSENGSAPASPIQVNAPGTLSGDGVTGIVTSLGGKVAPGNSPGLLKTSNFTLSSATTMEVELNGTSAGVNHDQVGVTGSVNLSFSPLNVLLGFSGAAGNKFVIIANDGNDAIAGTFKNLAEGATFFAGGAQFKISYHGGDGNDVELTQLSLATPSQIGGVKNLGNGQIQITGTGVANASYDIEANADLNTANWTKIGTVQANANGAISFTDANAANFARRFYRFKGN